MRDFNPRTPVGCDLRTRPATCWTRYFNPRTPVGCDGGIRQADARTRNFNPRTPVGCDRPVRGCVYGFAISIHAPQWGATVGDICFMGGNVFQSTHPSGVRPILLASVLVPAIISIHAPQWGATLPSNRAAISLSFQSTHPSGVRRLCPFVLGSFEIFQSTHPSGVRRSDTANIPPCANISIHAPQWGATHVGVHYGRSVFVQ